MRNVLFVSIDSLRQDTFQEVFCGQNPTIDSLLDDGVVFLNAVAPGPYTEISVPSTLVGEHLFHDGGDSNEVVSEQVASHGSVANELQRMGYSTCGFSPNPHASRYYGIGSGFDHFEDFLQSNSRREVARTLSSRVSSGDLVEGVRLAANLSGLSIPGFGNQSIPLRAYEQDVVRWAEEATQPWFLWVFLLEPHSPFRPTGEYREVSFLRMLRLNLVWSSLVDRNPSDEELEQLRGLYRGATKMTADAIARLYRQIERMDPVVVLHSDHGEAFGEHGSYGHDDHLFEENIHVPLAVLNVPASGEIEAPVSLTKVPEIIRDVATTGDVIPEKYTNDVAVSRVPGHSVSYRRRDTKLMVNSGIDLYDLESDPDETEPEPRPSLEQESNVQTFTTHQLERLSITEAVSTLNVPNNQ